MNSPTKRNTSYWLIATLAGYCVLGTIFLLANPLWEAPDEIHHFPMVLYLKSHRGSLPSQEPGTVGSWRQEGNQPPLYHLVGALLVSPIDTTDADAAMRINPHADVGIVRPDGNANLIVHMPSEQFPGSGAAFATYLLRFYSLALGAGTIYVTYKLGRELLPNRPIIALTAAGLNAFLPMFLFVSASVSNDNLSNLLANLLLLLLIRSVKAKEAPSLRSLLTVGIITGAGLLTKLSFGFLVPFIALTHAAIAIRKRDWRPLLRSGLVVGGLAVSIAGWWYLRNWRLFGDPTGLNRFLEIVGRRAATAGFAQLWTERFSFLHSFWGFFGSINVPMRPNLYPAFDTLAVLASASVLVFLVGRLKRRQTNITHVLAFAMALTWPIVTFGALLRWTSITPASQGRLLFGAISPIMILFAVGLTWWIPHRIRGRVAVGTVSALFFVAALQPFLSLIPAYAPPEEVAATEPGAVFSSNGGQIAIYNDQIYTGSVQPGSYVELTVDFEARTHLDRDWSIFVHLIAENEIIVGQRDVYPGRGQLATSVVQPGFAWRNPIAVFVPETAFTPAAVEVRLGMYDLDTGQRMLPEDGGDMLTIGQLELLPRSGFDGPNPQDIVFGGKIGLVGYDLSALTLAPALTKYADSNAMPVEWTRPTSTWERDEIVVDTHKLLVSPDAVQGTYPIEIGLYLQQDGYPRLGVIGSYNNYVYLTPVRIAIGSK
jgi:4-amino-4-deoxy-L-arabinose transferase-like glycosyltransferase